MLTPTCSPHFPYCLKDGKRRPSRTTTPMRSLKQDLPLDRHPLNSRLKLIHLLLVDTQRYSALRSDSHHSEAANMA